MKHIKLFESFDVEKELENLENAYQSGYDSFQMYQNLDPEKQRIWVEELDRLSRKIKSAWSKMGTEERIEYLKNGIKRKGFRDAQAGKEPDLVGTSWGRDKLKDLIPKVLDLKFGTY